jgi:hypothetical protein
MRGQKRDTLIRQYLSFSNECEEIKNQTKNIKLSSAMNRRYAKNIVFKSEKKYSFRLFIGDSKTPMGNFSLTFMEARAKNKSYQNKLFNSTDESYRLRTLVLTPESQKELKADIERTMIEVSNKAHK